MPDVHCWGNPSIMGPHVISCGGRCATKEEFADFLQQEVAAAMDCYGVGNHFMKHDPDTQVDILTLQAAVKTSKSMTIHVVAYDWPDRMRNIDERLAQIGESVKKHLGLPDKSVSMGYIIMGRGSKSKPGCWILV